MVKILSYCTSVRTGDVTIFEVEIAILTVSQMLLKLKSHAVTKDFFKSSLVSSMTKYHRDWQIVYCFVFPSHCIMIRV